MLKNIYLASDHAGFEHKEKTKKLLENNFPNLKIIDLGPSAYDPDDDYPDYISKAARKISQNYQNSKAIIFGGSGQGEAIVANRFNKVRAVVYYGFDNEIINLSRKHNDANILSIGTRFVREYDLENIINLWLHTEFSQEERHIRRIKKIEKSKNCKKFFDFF